MSGNAKKSFFCALVATIAAIAAAHVAASPGASQDDYSVGAGDLLSVTIADAPEFSGKFRVTESGEIALPGLPALIRVGGLTPAAISGRIAKLLHEAEIVNAAVVNVWVEEYNSRRVTVLGAVNKPSVYTLQRPTSVLEVISIAGGLLPAAGDTLTVIRKSDNSKRTISLSKLMQGVDPSLNIQAEPGDTLTVSVAPIIYVVGAVVKPGGFANPDPTSKTTALQALAFSEGLKPTAAGRRAVIIRRTASADRQEIALDLDRIMTRKIPDQLLQPNDILFVPESGMKRNLRKMGEVAIQGLNGIAIYGIGYRVAGVR